MSQDLPGDFSNPIGGPVFSTFVSEVDQMVIWYRMWQPPCGIETRAAVQITHGIAEYSARYDRLARFLAARGCVVYALDLRGHGQTAGPEGLGQLGVTAWEDMTADIKQLAEIARTQDPGLPLIAFGHSMGSALTQFHIQHHGDLLAGAVLCGTLGAVPGLTEEAYRQAIAELEAVATGSNAMAPSEFFGSLLAGFNDPFAVGGVTPTGSEWQTCDPEEIRVFQSDPLCGKPFSNAMTYSVIKGFHALWVPGNESRIPVELPILVIAGSEDPVGGRTATIQGLITRYLAEGHRRLEYRFYAGGRHEILNEPEKDRVQRDVGLWLESVLDAV
ncbi:MULTISPECIES: alpha/beta fold hydrolase [unclassified Mycobacterium]|uniref:alpha/beta fold hydrolase n=1 Tax=unclassified Mycobacterium TaxID=2642494 RepID=UPI00148318ED|nr:MULTISPECIES: alpha/beta fold hydrolase [unclassified Mycobacterium]